MTIEVNKKIKVGVIFKEKSAEITPCWFVKDGRQYRIEKINYIWDEKAGRSLLRHFSVTAEKTCYELAYDAGRMAWHMVSVDDEN
jgi:hypothetical protein